MFPENLPCRKQHTAMKHAGTLQEPRERHHLPQMGQCLQRDRSATKQSGPRTTNADVAPEAGADGVVLVQLSALPLRFKQIPIG